MNNCSFVGRLSKDVEFKYITSQGSAKGFCQFSLAVKRDYKDQSGEYGVDFISFKAFGKLAEIIVNHCGKGDQVALTSQCRTGSFEKEDGKKNYFTEFIVSNIEFLSKPTNKPTTANNPAVTPSYKNEVSNNLPY